MLCDPQLTAGSFPWACPQILLWPALCSSPGSPCSNLQCGHPLWESFTAADNLKLEIPTALCSLLELQGKKKNSMPFLCVQKGSLQGFLVTVWSQHRKVLDFNRMGNRFRVKKEGGCC